MDDLSKRIANLSPEKRKALIAKVRKNAANHIVSQARTSEPLELSFGQQRLWFLDQWEPESAWYTIAEAYRLRGRLDVAALEQSVQALGDRHEMLRTTFVQVQGEPRQMIAPQLLLSVQQIDLSTLPEGQQRDKVLSQMLQQEVQQPFHLAQGPLLRATLLRVREDEQVLLLTMHHIIADGWSMGILLQELTRFYEAFHLGTPSPLPPLQFHYADFAHWQRRWLQGTVLQQQLAYWRQQLAGAPAQMLLPIDFVRPPVQQYRGGQVHFRLSRTLSQELVALSKRENVTLFMLLLAAFQVVLARCCGQEEVVVGTPIANRTRTELEGLIGFVTNTLVLRTTLRGNPTFRELLKRVREVALGAYAHQDLPFEKLVEELHPQRDLSSNPLFQVFFVVQNASIEPISWYNLNVEPVTVESQTAKFDLGLFVQEEADGVHGVLQYRSDLFEAETIERMAGHLRMVMEACVADPEHPIGTMPLLTPQERWQVLQGWNATPRAYGEARCIHTLFEQQVQRTPQAVAVEYEGETLTYEALNRRANRVARLVRRRGVEPGMLVGICLERSLEMVIGLLGILKAGGAYVPLDPDYPVERLALMVQDAQVPVVLTQRRHQSLVQAMQTQEMVCLCLDEIQATLEQEDGNDLKEELATGHLMYVIYTSGSTGRPKGVMNSHQGVYNRLLWMQEAYQLRSEDRILQKTPYSFDVSVWEFFWPLITGARVVLARPQGQKDVAYLAQVIREARITVMHFVPSMLQTFLEEPTVPTCRTVRLVVCSGEALRFEVQERFFARMSARLENLYGPTEAAIDVTSWGCAPGTLQGKVPIGYPIANTQIYLLDHYLQPVPVGVEGEIYIGGHGVARGYLNQADLTAERFVPDPYGKERGGRLYRTGDLARYLPNGAIDYLGRADYQVKVRGYRIELEEIEAMLGQQAGVRGQSVLLQETQAGEKVLVAYVVLEPEVSEKQVRSSLQDHVPEYMVPAVFVRVKELPVTPNGKIDRRVLAQLDWQKRESEEGREAAQTPIEHLVVQMWEQVLAVHPIGLHENFFELGGHSLNATQIVARIRDAFSVELPLRTFFEKSTVAELAEFIEQSYRLQQNLTEEPVEPIYPISRTEPLELSFGQQRLWFLDQWEPESAWYTIAEACRLRGRLDVAALEQSVQALGDRYEMLRTTFVQVQGEPRQMIAPQLLLPVQQIDLSTLPEGQQRDKVLSQMLQQEVQQPFHLAQGPLLRATLLRVREDEQVLLLTMHHIIADGWSMGILLQELTRFYEAFHLGTPSPLPPLHLHYADFAHWQRRWLQGTVLQQQLAYWRQQLAGAPAQMLLPLDFVRPPIQRYRGGQVHFRLSRTLSQELVALSKRENVTLFMLLLAAFQVVLARSCGQEEVVVGTPIANRTRTELEGLVGFVTNTLVLRTSLRGNPTFRGLLKRVREVALGAYAHQDLPFEKLVEELHPQRDLSSNPLFQVFFALQNVPAEPISWYNLNVEPVTVESQTAKFDLGLFVQEEADGVHGVLQYRSDLFEAETIERMAGHLRMVMEACVADPEHPIGTMPLLTQQERWQVLQGWNATQRAYGEARCIHTLFEQQVQRTPQAVAVEYEGETLTYEALNRRANRVARLVRRRGVEPGMLVGICLERSLEMVIGLLGILKAGGAYVPLDPDYPVERLALMVQDAQVPVVLTQRRHQSLVQAMQTQETVCLCLDEIQATLDQEDGNDLKEELATGHLMYVIYTSGSTGRPKGVMNSHQGVCNRLLWMQEAYQLRSEDRVLQKTPYSFDVSVWEFFWPLITGARVVLARPQGQKDVAYLAQVIREARITVMHFVPSMLQTFLEEPTVPTCRTVRLVVCSGEALRFEVQERFFARMSTRLENLYGPTEAAIDVTSWGCMPGTLQGKVPIGYPIANTQIYVLDHYLQPVPVGVGGEIYIGGHGVARGYLNQADLTAERFVPDPYGKERGGRLYRTGDLARYLPNGAIDYLGRADYQVKVRGYRIELEEIEAMLGQQAGVRGQSVLLQETQAGEKVLVAYVVLEPEVSEKQVRSSLQEHVPEYMVPAVFVRVEELPVTSNGKIDRRVLAQLDWQKRESEEGREAAQTLIEHLVVQMWEQVLAVHPIGLHENFFELGGHSLNATQIVVSIWEKFNIKFQVKDLFLNATVYLLAARIKQMMQTNGEEKYPSIVALPEQPYYDLSHAQKRLWFIDQLLDNDLSYMYPLQVNIRGNLEYAIVQEGWQYLFERHQSLRTIFVKKDGDPKVVVQKKLNCNIQFYDFRGDEAEKKMMEVIHQDQLHPFSLSEGPLIRISLFRLKDIHHCLYFNMHHIITDGWSTENLLEEFIDVYGALYRGEPISLEPLAFQPTDYTAWEKQMEATRKWKNHEKHMQEELAKPLPLLALPLDFPKFDVRTYKGGEVFSETTPDLYAKLAAVAHEQNASLFMLLLTAYFILLKHLSRQDDIIIGFPVAGRNAKEMESAMGFFVNTLMIRIKFAECPDINSLLEKVKEKCLQSYEYQDYPFDLLIKKVNPERELSQSSIFSTMLTMNNYSKPHKSGVFEWSIADGPEKTSKFDLSLTAAEEDDCLKFSFTYNTDLFKEETAQMFCEQYLSVLKYLVETL